MGTIHKQEIINALALSDFTPVYEKANQLTQERFGEVVNIRAILEFSNHCRRQCAYCGLNRNNTDLPRYRMMPQEMIETAQHAADAGYKTLVMQSGEDPYFTPKLLGDIVKEIKKTGMAITLSCGERPAEDYHYWKACGADRYLLKHETADEALYQSLHPCGTLKSRINCLKALKSLGYETGSGFMIGLPGQTLSTIADDILLLKEIGCDMAGIGPFIPHPKTPLHACPPGNPELAKRAVALTRLILPVCNLPATTSLGVIGGKAKEDVFFCGANVVMKKVTPDRYKELYEIYPAKLSHTEIFRERRELEQQIKALGKSPL